MYYWKGSGSVNFVQGLQGNQFCGADVSYRMPLKNHACNVVRVHFLTVVMKICRTPVQLAQNIPDSVEVICSGMLGDYQPKIHE